MTEEKEYINSKCPNCGSELKFLPGTNKIKCISCDSTFDIDSLGSGKLDEEEVDLSSTLKELEESKINKEIIKTIHCQDCGGLILLNDQSLSLTCPFCGSHRVILQDEENEIIKIAGVIPFQIDEKQIQEDFKKWIKKHFFAPKSFKNGRIIPTFTAFYIPFYTFDANTVSPYSGYRGDYYYTTRTVGSGNSRHTVTERHTRWSKRSGIIKHNFDDVLISGNSSPLSKYIVRISHYDFEKMEKYQEKFLLGYYSEKSSLSLKDGFNQAKSKMMDEIKYLCIREIGGDTYSNLNFKTTFSNVTFKQIMAPIYNGYYPYKNKNYNFVVNGQSGKFSGSYPISALKITLLVLLILLFLVLFFIIIFVLNENDMALMLKGSGL